MTQIETQIPLNAAADDADHADRIHTTRIQSTIEWVSCVIDVIRPDLQKNVICVICVICGPV